MDWIGKIAQIYKTAIVVKNVKLSSYFPLYCDFTSFFACFLPFFAHFYRHLGPKHEPKTTIIAIIFTQIRPTCRLGLVSFLASPPTQMSPAHHS